MNGIALKPDYTIAQRLVLHLQRCSLGREVGDLRPSVPTKSRSSANEKASSGPLPAGEARCQSAISQSPQLALKLFRRCFSAAFAVVGLAIADAVIRWRTDGHLTAPGMELAHHACGLVLAGLASCCLDASPLGGDGLR